MSSYDSASQRRLLPPSEDIAKFIKGTAYIAETTSYERHTLHENWKEEVDWVSSREGRLIQVGTLAGEPVNIEATTAVIDGMKVLFYSSCSMIVDYSLITKWLSMNLPAVESTDATNFSNCIHAIRR